MATHAQMKAAAAKRRKEIVRLSKTKTHREIANVMGVSAQRIGQIIAAERAKK